MKVECMCGLRKQIDRALVLVTGVVTLAFCSGCATVPETQTAAVHHVVLFWLKEPGNAEQRRKIIEASRAFKEIPGVIDVRAGQVLESKREIVDDSFDVAIVMTFVDARHMEEYLTNPKHEEAKKKVLLPVLKKMVVYDFHE